MLGSRGYHYCSFPSLLSPDSDYRLAPRDRGTWYNIPGTAVVSLLTTLILLDNPAIDPRETGAPEEKSTTAQSIAASLTATTYQVVRYPRAVCHLCSDVRSYLYTMKRSMGTSYPGLQPRFWDYTHAILPIRPHISRTLTEYTYGSKICNFWRPNARTMYVPGILNARSRTAPAQNDRITELM